MTVKTLFTHAGGRSLSRGGENGVCAGALTFGAGGGCACAIMPGIKGRLGYKNLFLELGAKTALQENCGTVYDSDWLNVSALLGCSDDYASIKTNYTESDCKANYCYEFSGEISYMFKIADSLSFSPFAEISYAHSSFSAIDGGGSYYNLNLHEANGYYGYYNDAENSYDVEISGKALIRISSHT